MAAVLFARSSNQNANRAATEERKAVIEREIAVTAQADAEFNLDLASTREAEAIFAEQNAQDEADFRATAEVVALDNQHIAEQQQALTAEQLRLTTSRELALAANANMETNPERSLLLSLTALENAYTKEAEEALRVALQESRLLFTLGQGNGNFTSIAYNPDEMYLAGIDNQGISSWNPANGESMQDIPLNDIDFRPNTQLKISPNGNLAAITAGNKTFILNTDTWETILTLELDNPEDSIDSLDFKPAGTILATGSEKGIFTLWDLNSGEALFSRQASDGGFADDVRFSRDGQHVVTSGDDLTGRVWDVETGVELFRVEHEGLWINNAAFNADGTRFLPHRRQIPMEFRFPSGTWKQQNRVKPQLLFLNG